MSAGSFSRSGGSGGRGGGTANSDVWGDDPRAQVERNPFPINGMGGPPPGLAMGGGGGGGGGMVNGMSGMNMNSRQGTPQFAPHAMQQQQQQQHQQQQQQQQQMMMMQAPPSSAMQMMGQQQFQPVPPFSRMRGGPRGGGDGGDGGGNGGGPVAPPGLRNGTPQMRITTAGSMPGGGGQGQSSSFSSTTTTQLNDDDSVRVVVRIRPLNDNEKANGQQGVIAAQEDGRSLQVRTQTGGGARESVKQYSFNKVCHPGTTQEQFFDNCGIRGLLDSALNGYAATAFAYGQTGSGKTFTISGHSERIETVATSAAGSPFDGLVPRSIRYVFESIERARASALRPVFDERALGVQKFCHWN